MHESLEELGTGLDEGLLVSSELDSSGGPLLLGDEFGTDLDLGVRVETEEDGLVLEGVLLCK